MTGNVSRRLPHTVAVAGQSASIFKGEIPIIFLDQLLRMLFPIRRFSIHPEAAQNKTDGCRLVRWQVC